MKKISYRFLLILLITLFFIVITAEVAVYLIVNQRTNVTESLFPDTIRNEAGSLALDSSGIDNTKMAHSEQISTVFSCALGYALLQSLEDTHYRKAVIAAAEDPNCPLFALQYTLTGAHSVQNKKDSFSGTLSKAMQAKKKFQNKDIRDLAKQYIYNVEKESVADVSIRLFGKTAADLTLSENIRFAAFYPHANTSVTGFNRSFIEKCRIITQNLSLDGTISAHDKAMCMDEFR